jgi:hypothetical protein
MGGESYELVIVAQADDDAPPINRLRMVLKALLRAHGFRCTSCRNVTPALPPVAQGPAVAGVPGGATAGATEGIE